VGVIVRDVKVARKMQEVFETDWAHTKEAVEEAEARDKGKEKDSENEKAISGA
jgi:phosphatidylserine/phosphatidylglycerophosphate/cardiolipin synthase-like enzyme